MYLIRQILLLLSPVLWLGGLFFVRTSPQNYYWFFGVWVLYLFFLLMIVCRQKIDRTFWRFLI
ncbi:MAG: hypothetical protein WCT18_03180, partial [Patescibacteria group bacterium]